MSIQPVATPTAPLYTSTLLYALTEVPDLTWMALLADQDACITQIILGDDKAAVVQQLPAAVQPQEALAGHPLHAHLMALRQWLQHPSPTMPELPVRWSGTPFQQSVWHYLRTIPVGATCSYAKVAAAIERPRAVRAVAQACASNPLPLWVPCHRVIQSNGGLGGYSGGIALKKRLLSAESSIKRHGTVNPLQ